MVAAASEAVAAGAEVAAAGEAATAVADQAAAVPHHDGKKANISYITIKHSKL